MNHLTPFISLRLDAASTRPLEEKARTLLETSRSLVSRIQSEARNLVVEAAGVWMRCLASSPR